MNFLERRLRRALGAPCTHEILKTLTQDEFSSVKRRMIGGITVYMIMCSTHQKIFKEDMWGTSCYGSHTEVTRFLLWEVD